MAPLTNTKFKPLLLPTQVGMLDTNIHNHKTLYFKSTLTFRDPAMCWKSISTTRQKPEILAIFSPFIIIRKCGNTLYVGLTHAVPPLIQNLSRYFSRLMWVCRPQTLTNTEHHISNLHSHLLVQLNGGSDFAQPDKNGKLLRFFIVIRECGSTPYVGLACTAPPTNTNFG